MTTATLTAEKPFRDYTATIKCLIFAVTLVLLTACLICMDTVYTRQTSVTGTVIAKAEITAVASANKRFIVALQDSEGGLHNVTTDFARYATMPVGASWTIKTSPKDEGLSKPWQETARGSLIALLACCCPVAFWMFFVALLNSDLPPKQD